MRSIPDYETVEIMLDREHIVSEKGAKLPLADGLVSCYRNLRSVRSELPYSQCSEFHHPDDSTVDRA